MKHSSYPPIGAAFPLVFLLWTGALEAAPVYTQGNGFSYTGANSASSNTSNGQYARFTAREDVVATSLSINMNASTASFTYGLQADDGTGKPSGVYLASTTATLAATSGWQTLALPNLALVEGNVYHVVISPTASGSALWRLLNGVPDIGAQPYGVKDAMFGRGGIPSGVPGDAVSTNATVYHIGVSTPGADGLGQPYTGAAFTSLHNASNIAAQRFIHYAGASGNLLDTVTLRLSTGATRPANDVVVTLLSDDDIVLGSSTLSRLSLVESTTGDYTVSFGGEVSLEDGKAYRLALSSVGSASNSIRWSAMITDNDDYTSSTFQGNDGYAFTYTSADWSTTGAAILRNDYTFTYATIPEPTTALFALSGAGMLWFLRRGRSRANVSGSVSR